MNPPSPRGAYASTYGDAGSVTPPAAAPPPAGGSEDVELVRRMSGGDDGALAALYDRWSRPVFALVVHIVRDADEADDVVEEVFWQAWRQASRFDAARGGVSTWLMTIARSRALDRLRSLRRRRAEEPALGDDPASAGSANRADAVTAAAAAAAAAPATGADPSVAAEAVERRERVQAALGELPPEQREALELAYFEGLSQSEVAERTGQPLGTVKTRMRLGMQKLRQKLSVLREGGP